MGTGGPCTIKTLTYVVHLQGFEPGTHWLRVSCSTNWAKGAKFEDVLFMKKTFIENRTKGNMCRKETQVILSWTWSSSPRSISIDQLNTLLCLHLRPIKLVVYKWPYLVKPGGISNLEVCFTLRCLQRLSRPHAATQLCPWQNNWCTGGASNPVLSY